MADFVTVNNESLRADKKDLEAQKQWELRGTVTADYLRRVLGDISQPVLVQVPDVKKREHCQEQRS